MAKGSGWLWAERGAIIAAILSLWPCILRWPNPVWSILMYCMLGVMVVLFVINVRRLWRMGHPQTDHRED